ncbi:hypothetical protein [Shouchella patagoniensis]|uniref:hypothetical protein n=1 Tax=Shouchella patagoniensis TaxID=228576 RepID=UPI000995C206|nr:hypothetical protein [Shouchella patagoniensis]
MAIVQPYTKTVYGMELTFENAYHRIYRISVTHDLITIDIDIYQDETKANLVDSISRIFVSNENSGYDIIQIGYALIKQLPEYSGAMNIFEQGQPLRELAPKAV